MIDNSFIRNAVIQEFRIEQKKGMGGSCLALILIALGVVVLIVPVIGWVVGPALIILATMLIISPVHGRYVFESVFAREDLKNTKKRIKHFIESGKSYNIDCPVCRKDFEAEPVSYYNNKYLKCPHCNNEDKKWVFDRNNSITV